MTYQPTVEELETLVGNPDVYAKQTIQGEWFPVREPLTRKVLRQHIKREYVIGTYIVKPPDEARTLVFDVDDEDRQAARETAGRVEAVLETLGLAHGVEFSGKKGYHVWVRASDYMPAGVLYQLGRGIRDELELPRLEVFPKQTEVRDLGNLVKLPGGMHAVTEKPNRFLGSAFPEANMVEVVEAAAAKYPEVTARRGVGTEGPVEYPCVANIQEGVPEGARNNHLFHLAVMLRKFSLSDENVEAVVRRANEKSDPPLEEWELVQLLDSSRWSGPVCDLVEPDRHCGDQCIKKRHPGLYTRSGAGRWAADGEEFVVRVAGRADDGRVLELEHPDFVQARAVLAEPGRRGKRHGD